MELCSVCGEPAKVHCSRCEAYYCGQACHTADGLKQLKVTISFPLREDDLLDAGILDAGTQRIIDEELDKMRARVTMQLVLEQ